MSNAAYAGPAFDAAITQGKFTEGRVPETEAHYIDRMKMLGTWLLSRMEFLRASEANRAICQARLDYLQQLIEDATRSQYSKAAAAIAEINEEMVPSPRLTAEQIMQANKDEFSVLAGYYEQLYDKMNELKNASARSWIAKAPKPGSVRF